MTAAPSCFNPQSCLYQTWCIIANLPLLLQHPSQPVILQQLLLSGHSADPLVIPFDVPSVASVSASS